MAMITYWKELLGWHFCNLFDDVGLFLSGTKWCVAPKLDWKFTRGSYCLRFLFLFNNKTLNVPHDTTFCMENNAKTLIIHGYKFVITWHNSNGHTCNGIYIFFLKINHFNSAYSSPPGNQTKTTRRETHAAPEVRDGHFALSSYSW